MKRKTRPGFEAPSGFECEATPIVAGVLLPVNRIRHVGA
jgi:hypothetical protein